MRWLRVLHGADNYFAALSLLGLRRCRAVCNVIIETETQPENMTMEYTIAQLEAGLADAKAEYKNAKAVEAAYPCVEHFFNIQNARARIKRINTLIKAA